MSLVGCFYAQVIDELDAFIAHMEHHTYRKAIMFVDNCGADVLLGMLPLARELIKRGTTVVMAANSSPCINDITAEELLPLLQQAAKHDACIQRALLEGCLTVVPSGNALAVIDLQQVSSEELFLWLQISTIYTKLIPTFCLTVAARCNAR